MKKLALLASAMLLLQSCALAPSAPQSVPVAVPTCPVIPPVERLPQDVLEPNFTGPMQLFLSGKLPEQS